MTTSAHPHARPDETDSGTPYQARIGMGHAGPQADSFVAWLDGQMHQARLVLDQLAAQAHAAAAATRLTGTPPPAPVPSPTTDTMTGAAAATPTPPSPRTA